jgi:AcrR family transcriptional regulator
VRSDAERNRERILTAAREVFAEQGLEVPMSEVARCAGVGAATLQRRFPSREDLITATFASKMTDYANAIDRALAKKDPWQAFCAYIEEVCAMQAADRGFTSVLTLTFPLDKQFEGERARAYHGLVELIKRAKESGQLRKDFSPEDLVLVMMANAGVITAMGDAAPEAWRRVVAYLVQAFSAKNQAELPPAPKPGAVYRAMLRLTRSQRPAAGAGEERER